MLHYLPDTQPSIHIPLQHASDQIDTTLTHDPRNAELMIHDFVDAVKGVFFIDESVKEDAEGPDVLFFAAVRFPLQYFRGGVICEKISYG